MHNASYILYVRLYYGRSVHSFHIHMMANTFSSALCALVVDLAHVAYGPLLYHIYNILPTCLCELGPRDPTNKLTSKVPKDQISVLREIHSGRTSLQDMGKDVWGWESKSATIWMWTLDVEVIIHRCKDRWYMHTAIYCCLHVNQPAGSERGEFIQKSLRGRGLPKL